MDNRIYNHAFCSNCDQIFYVRDVTHPVNTRTPLVLGCGHAACEPCIRSVLRERKEVVCGICKHVSPYTGSSQDVRSVFPIHLHLLGEFANRPLIGGQKDRVSFKPAKRKSADNKSTTAPCVECEKKAAISCKQCGEPFCDACFLAVHSKHKSLQNHQKQPLFFNGSKSEVATCAKHPSYNLDFYCKECNVSVCMACTVLSPHGGHTFLSLLDQNEAMLPSVEDAYKEARRVRQRLIQTNKELQLLGQTDCQGDMKEIVDAERALASYLVQAHGLLQLCEARAMEHLGHTRAEHESCLDRFSAQLGTQVEALEAAMAQARVAMHPDRLARADFAGVLQKLEEAAQVPAFVLRNTETGSLRIKSDPDAMEKLKEFVEVEVPENTYYLVAEDELPPDYTISPLSPDETDDVQNELSFSTGEGNNSPGSTISLTSSSRNQTAPPKDAHARSAGARSQPQRDGGAVPLYSGGHGRGRLQARFQTGEEPGIGTGAPDQEVKTDLSPGAASLAARSVKSPRSTSPSRYSPSSDASSPGGSVRNGSLEGNSPVNANLNSNPRPGSKATTLLQRRGSFRSSIELKEGDFEDVYVTHISDPNLFYAQRLSSMKQLSEATREYIQHARNALPIKEVHKDGLYLVQYEADKKWYRGRVLRVLDDKCEDKEVEIFFVDYGNSAKVKMSTMRKISPRLAYAPYECVRCSLYDIMPPNGQWENSAVVAMARMIAESAMRMYVMRVDPDRLQVDLCHLSSDLDSEMPTSIRDALLFLGEGCFPGLDKSQMLQAKNSCLKRFLKDSRTIAIGSNHDIRLSHVESPSDFYVQRLTNGQYLSKLMRQMEIYYKGLPPDKSLVYVPVIGMACVARYSVDNHWYRARVVELPAEKRKVKVQYVDYGNSEVLLWSELRVLGNDFLRLPEQALHCSLIDVVPYGGRVDWSKEASNVLIDLERDGHALKIFVEGVQEEILKVTLYDVRQDRDLCVNALLVCNKLAVSTGDSSVLVEYMKNDDELKVLKQEYDETLEQEDISPESELAGDLDLDDFSSAAELAHVTKYSRSVQTRLDKAKGVGEKKEAMPLKVSVKVLAAESPSCIYVMMTNWQKQIEELIDEMTKFYESGGLADEDWTPEVRGCCAALSEEDCRWYRGVVLEIQREGKIKVMLKDKAKCELLDIKSVRPLASTFTKVRDGTFKCHLADIKAAGATTSGTKTVWSTLAVEKLNELIAKYEGKLFITKKGQICMIEKSLPVEMEACVTKRSALEAAVEEWITINEMLVDGGVALPNKSNDEGTVLTLEDLELLDSCDPDSNVLAWLTHTKQDVPSTPEDDSEISVSFEPSEDSDQDNPLTFDAVTSGVCDWLPPEPFVSRKFLGTPTYVDHEGYVYLHDNSKSAEILRVISAGLKSRYAKSKPRPHDTYWFAGQICIGLYHHDECWYRGRVLKVDENNLVKVQFVDYGNVEECRATELRKNVFLTDIPVQARKCRLEGLQPISEDGQWPIGTLDFIHITIVDQPCKVKIIRDPIPDDMVYVVNLVLPSGLSIREVLLGMRYVTYCPPGENTRGMPEELSDIEEDDDVLIDNTVEVNITACSARGSPSEKKAVGEHAVGTSPTNVMSQAQPIQALHTSSMLNLISFSDSDCESTGRSERSNPSLAPSTRGESCNVASTMNPVETETDNSLLTSELIASVSSCSSSSSVSRKECPTLGQDTKIEPLVSESSESSVSLSSSILSRLHKLKVSNASSSKSDCDIKEIKSEADQATSTKIEMTNPSDRISGEKNRTLKNRYNSILNPKQLSGKQYRPPNVPSGDVWKVQVTSILSATELYLQIEEAPDTEWSKQRSDFTNLMKEIQGQALEQPELSAISSGKLCCGVVSGTWYRAKVLESKGESATVEFVDGGSQDTLARTNLREIPLAWVELPVQAVECVLSGITVVPDVNIHELCEELAGLIFGRSLYAKVVHRRPLEVELYLQLGKDGPSKMAYHSLVDKNLLCFTSKG